MENSNYNKMIEGNMNLVYFVVNKMCSLDYMKYEKDDMIQTGMVGLIKAVKTFDSSKDLAFSTYAATVIKNEILMYIKRIRKFHFNDISLETEILNSLTDEYNSISIYLVDEKADNEFKLAVFNMAMDKCLAKLDDKEREVITMKLRSEYSQIEIAKILGVSQFTISKRIRLGMRKLRHYLKEEGITESFFDENISKR